MKMIVDLDKANLDDMLKTGDNEIHLDDNTD